MRSLIIGAGQIGKALHEIFGKAHISFIRDIEDAHFEDIDVLHVAFPYSETFVLDTAAYIAKYKPKLTIIHSSVAVGTTDVCGAHVVHSPERGRFPNLEKQMKAFPKYVGGGSDSDREYAKAFFDALEWQTVLIEDARWTELCKILSNVHLGLEIAWRQEVDRISGTLIGRPAGSIYAAWEHSYTDGLLELDEKQLIRPTVRPAPIGGHCILPCVNILGGQFDSKLFDFIKESNAKRKTEEITDAAVSSGNAVSHR